MQPRKNILLVYPQVPNNTYWSFHYALSFVGKKSSMPPLGLITLAAMIPDTYTLKLVDMNVTKLIDDDLGWADLVFISAMIVQKASFQSVVQRCRKFGRTVVAGGPYPTRSYGEITGVDHFVLGEVEDTFAQFLADFEQGRARLIYSFDHRPDMAKAVLPRFDLLDLSAYASMSVQYSRGCPFKCEFCDIWTVYGNRTRVKPAQKMIAEIDYLHELGWRGPVFIVDDNFIGNKKRVKKELLPALIHWQKSHRHIYRFFTEASINLANDPELLSAMRDAGFNEVFIGIETPSKAALKETGKSQNLKVDMVAAIRTIQRYGMEVMAGFILGFDSDKEDIFQRQIDFIQRAAIPKAMIGLLTALPGTQLYERLQNQDRILAASAGNNTHHMMTNFKTRMAPELLKQGYRKVLAAIYDPHLKNYFARCNQLLDSIEDRALFQRPVAWREIRILFKSLMRQPFTAYGGQFVRFAIRNFFKNRSIFGESIKFAIEGHHFHMITRESLKADQLVSALEKGYADYRQQLDCCLTALKTNSADAMSRAAVLWGQNSCWLNQIKKKIEKVQGDFQEDVRQRYADVSRSIYERFRAFESSLPEVNMESGHSG
jgi:radical SAM superfamily enzyme YgiQ (UPF0313 family)